MREKIHPKYYPNAQVICSCGNTWTTGSTREVIRTDVCSQCHPFFTGEQRIIDSAGQVDRFMKRLDRYSAHQTDAAKRQEETRRKLEQRFMKQQLAALDLDSKLYQVLSDANVVTVGDLSRKIDKNRADLLALEGVGAETLDDLKARLQEARASYFAEAQ